MSANRPQMEPGFTVVLFFIVAFMFAVAFWMVAKIPILECMRWLRIFELWIVSIFTDAQDPCIHWLRNVRYGETQPSSDIITWGNQCFGAGFLARIPQKELIDYFRLSPAGLSAIEMKATYYIHYPLAAVYVGLLYYIIYLSPRNQFRTKYTLESFIKIQAKIWPVISPIINFNPIKASARMPGTTVPDKLPMFAEALSPEDWLAWHRIPVTNGIADRETTRRAFLLQLGPRWNGIDGQPPYIRALFAACALKGAQKREESDDFLGEVALCWSQNGGLKLTAEVEAKIRGILRDPSQGGKAGEIANEHAWRTTAMLGVLRWARAMGGVLAPAQFLWLRGVDRDLWYALNNLGRRSFHSEGAGAMAHFMAEQNAKKPLPIPRIDTAIITLNQYLAGSGLPIPPREA